MSIESVSAFLTTLIVVTSDQFTAWRYGVVGLVALALLAIGLKADKPACSAVGATMLALLVTRPATW
ncbi:hypothetical protein [Streptomyces sp. NPDC001507]|uniref:hypothetical protein n=1 Tax=Streptomyces sp. NPDC001507 TaxID=3364579 RepID=UPI0036A78D49